jgi:hypothetical protein
MHLMPRVSAAPGARRPQHARAPARASRASAVMRRQVRYRRRAYRPGAVTGLAGTRTYAPRVPPTHRWRLNPVIVVAHEASSSDGVEDVLGAASTARLRGDDTGADVGDRRRWAAWPRGCRGGDAVGADVAALSMLRRTLADQSLVRGSCPTMSSAPIGGSEAGRCHVQRCHDDRASLTRRRARRDTAARGHVVLQPLFACHGAARYRRN